MNTRIVASFMCLILIAAVSCGGHDDPLPEKEVPEEKEPSLIDFLGIWEADSVLQISGDDFGDARHILVSSKWVGEIQIQGIFRTFDFKLKKAEFPTLRATQTNGNFQIPRQEFYTQHGGVFFVEGAGKLLNKEINFQLEISTAEGSRVIEFNSRQICSTLACQVFDSRYLGTFILGGVRWIRKANMCADCPPYDDVSANISYRFAVTEQFPFAVEVEVLEGIQSRYSGTLAAFFRNDSLIIPRQFPRDDVIVFEGNAVKGETGMVLKLKAIYADEILYDTLMSD
jgi:hypothetical protein